MAQIPISNVKGPQSQSAGPLHSSGVNRTSNQKAEFEKDVIIPQNKMAMRVQRHAQWAQITQIHEKAVGLKGKEELLDRYQQGLINIAKLTTKSTVNIQAISVKADRLAQDMRGSHVFDGNLELAKNPPIGNYILDRVDLLKERPESESLVIRLPNGGLSELEYSEGQSQNENFTMVARELQYHGLTATMTEGGQLQVSGKKINLDAPWMFQGQGIRVPAGNPVNIRLKPEEDAIGRLSESLRSGDADNSRVIIKSLIGKIDGHRTDIVEEQKQVVFLTKKMGLSNSVNAEKMTSMSYETGQAIGRSDFKTQLQALSAQANLTRQSVTSSLTD
jgi:hypothetical protein